jgi:hypothetical protein
MSANTSPLYTFASGSGTVPLPVRYTIGVDLGKHADYTALAIAEERPERVEENWRRVSVALIWGEDPDFTIPWLQRWPLGTPYFTIATEVGKLVATLDARPQTEVQLYLDGTGVGTAVVEIFRANPAIKLLQTRFSTVTITAGHEATGGAGDWHVPKKDLVGAAQVPLQRGKLKVAESLPEAQVLTAELRNFEVNITLNANAVYSHRDGEHDDLVLAVALALWGAKKRPNYAYSFSYLGQGRGDIPPYGNGVRPYGSRR